MYKTLDPILHAPLRLTIMAYLSAHTKVSFNELKNQTDATSGNLSIQLKKLEEAEYIAIRKSFSKNYPLTQVSLTAKGIKAFEIYVAQLKKMILPK